MTVTRNHPQENLQRYNLLPAFCYQTAARPHPASVVSTYTAESQTR
jgi:hypothetical protein